jgi:hypothetical protein
MLAHGPRCRQRDTTLALSEVMTIEGAFHQSGYRTFKDFYLRYITLHLRWAFPRLVGYTRFSVANFLVNLVAGLIVYMYQAKKPSLHIRTPQSESWPALVP